MLLLKGFWKYVKWFPRRPKAIGIRGQLGGAGSAVGANYEEADGAITKKDFINKVSIARKEAKESRYWLRVINGTLIPEEEVREDIRESEEIINILSSMLIKSGVHKRK